MLRRLTIVMTEKEREALQVLADRDMRPARDQLRWLIMETAIERGLLPEDTEGKNIDPAATKEAANAAAR